MTSTPPLEERESGRRKDALRMETDRRRADWRRFRLAYPRLVIAMAVALVLFLAADAWLLREYLLRRTVPATTK